MHKGEINNVYNVGSYDEISNLTLCSKLLTYLNIPHATQEELHKWVKHTIDRPFNDHRYAVDGTKLRQLGWEQKTSFSEGMKITVDWYKNFGEKWWGDITTVLTPFPTVHGTQVEAGVETVTEIPETFQVGPDDELSLGKKRKVGGDDTTMTA